MESSYITHARQVRLTPDPTQVAVRFREPAPHAARSTFARNQPVEEARALRYEIPGEKFTVFPVAEADGYDEAALPKLLRTLGEDESVARVAPVFRSGSNSLVATDRIVVKLQPGARRAIHRFEERGYEVVDQHHSTYLVRLREGDDPLQVASAMAGENDVEYAAPDFVEYGDLDDISQPQPADSSGGTAHALNAVDTLAIAQWARGQVGADDAMELLGGAGSPAIRIAIVDAGVDRSHPDLAQAIAGVFDAADEPPTANPQDVDSHGTACAGLAAAVPNNIEGIRGFGGGCSILAVRVMYTSGQPRRWKMSGYAIARGINWAVANGADVVNLSLVTRYPHQTVVDAINDAVANGRKGMGCVVIAGTGNDTKASPPGVKFPALLPGVIAVAATDENDTPVDFAEGSSSWGSASGPQVAIAAPGTRQWTTDNTAGKGATGGDYMESFGGTSAATAVVAGAAGLVLSANPRLTAAQVRDVLCSTAKRIETVTYDGKGHSDRVGAGRLDLLAAVTKALSTNGTGGGG